LAIFNQLDDILSQHLSRNAKLSICCYGRKAVMVSLHEFNELCILPRRDWRFRFVSKHPSSDLAMVSPFLLEHQERESLIVNKFTSTKKSLLLVFQDVIQQHPKYSFIHLHLPKEIPNPWALATLGIKNKSANFTPPSSIGTIRQRITISIDQSILRKNVLPRFNLFCKESGSFWLLDDDGVGL
jgi:hypothetical protein